MNLGIEDNDKSYNIQILLVITFHIIQKLSNLARTRTTKYSRYMYPVGNRNLGLEENDDSHSIQFASVMTFHFILEILNLARTRTTPELGFP